MHCMVILISNSLNRSIVIFTTIFDDIHGALELCCNIYHVSCVPN